MIKNVKRTWDIVYLFRKHYRPKCNNIIKLLRCSEIVNSKSDEAVNFDFSSSEGKGYMYGDVKFI